LLTLEVRLMTESLSMAEIEARYPAEWVLIGAPETDQYKRVLNGQVLHHSKDRDEMYSQALTMALPDFVAIQFTGPPPTDMEFLL